MWKFCKWVNEEEAINANRKNLNTKKAKNKQTSARTHSPASK